MLHQLNPSKKSWMFVLIPVWIALTATILIIKFGHPRPSGSASLFEWLMMYYIFHTIVTIVYSTLYWHPGDKWGRHFVVDPVTKEAKPAPSGLYWRLLSRTFRRKGNVLIALGGGISYYPVGKFELMVGHGSYTQLTAQQASKTYQLFLGLEKAPKDQKTLESVIACFNQDGQQPQATLMETPIGQGG